MIYVHLQLQFQNGCLLCGDICFINILCFYFVTMFSSDHDIVINLSVLAFTYSTLSMLIPHHDLQA